MKSRLTGKEKKDQVLIWRKKEGVLFHVNETGKTYMTSAKYMKNVFNRKLKFLYCDLLSVVEERVERRRLAKEKKALP